MIRRRFVHGLTIAAAAVPFAFAAIRAAATGSDFRYFLVALASLLGAVTTIAVLASGGRKSPVLAAASAVFVVATLCAVSAAMLIGTTLGLGLLVVGAAFGFWFAVAGFAYASTRYDRGQ